MSLVRAVLCLAMAGLFIVQAVQAQTSGIVITEIGAYEASGHEWVEIYNNGSTDVDLTGWKFWENETNHGLSLARGESMILSRSEYAVIVQNDETFLTDYPGVNVKIIDSSWGSLNESGEEIGLKDAEGNFVEKFTYTEAKSFSLERKDYSADDYSAVNWQEHPDANTVAGQNSNYTATGPASGEKPITDYRLLITEILPNPNTGENEWVEIYNESGESVSLSDWTLEDGVGVIYTFIETIPAGGFLVAELDASKLNNSGDMVVLKNFTDEKIDSQVYGNWNDGDTSDNWPTPNKGASLSRYGNEFFIDENPTRGAANNEQTATESEQKSVPQDSEDVNFENYVSGEVVINELVSDPADTEVEFVELYNRSGRTIDLTGWWLEEGSESQSLLAGLMPPGSFYVFQKPKGNLNNSGDIIYLYDPSGLVIDRVTYGNWDDGDTADNAEAAKDPYSLARKTDGHDADNDFYDFVVTKTVTKGSNNIILDINEDKSGQEPSNALVGIRTGTFDRSVIINELYPNPPGSDREDEFIELKNTGKNSVDLTGWLIGDKSKKRFEIKDGLLDPGEYLILKRSLTGIALNNSGGDEVSLYDPNGTVVNSISYDEFAPEEFSYSFGAEYWAWSATPTPGDENIVTDFNKPPTAVIYGPTVAAVGEEIIFDASDSTDPEGDTLEFKWYFGEDKVLSGELITLSFDAPGNYNVTLSVTDGSGNFDDSNIILNVKGKESFTGGEFLYDAAERLIISEIFPNPFGSDSAEFIELYNPTGQYADLSGLKLDDEEGGSRPFTIPDGNSIAPGEYLVFGKQETGIALNNTTDSARLLFPIGEIIHEVAYEKAAEGASLVYANGEWVWTNEATPGLPNIVKKPEQSINVSSDKSSSKRIKSVVETTLFNISMFDAGDIIKITGAVAVEPGVLGSQFFYMVDLAGQAGIQVYQHKKDFPVLRVGDLVQVSGEISEAYGEARLKVKSGNDIAVVEYVGAPEAQLIEIASIDEGYSGRLIKIAGEVTETKSSYLYVDDGTDEIRVYFKKNVAIDKERPVLGDLVEIVGIVSQSRSRNQILPRSTEDIVITGSVDTEINAAGTLVKNNEKEVAEKYLTATAGGLTSILIGLLAKARGAAAVGVLKRMGKLVLSVWRK